MDFVLTKFQNLPFLGQFPTLLDPYRQRLLTTLIMKKLCSGLKCTLSTDKTLDPQNFFSKQIPYQHRIYMMSGAKRSSFSSNVVNSIICCAKLSACFDRPGSSAIRIAKL